MQNPSSILLTAPLGIKTRNSGPNINIYKCIIDMCNTLMFINIILVKVPLSLKKSLIISKILVELN
jgi:hypothetical protein